MYVHFMYNCLYMSKLFFYIYTCTCTSTCINNYTQLRILFYYRLRSGSEIAERDIVQFVPFRDFKQVQKYYYHNIHIFIFPLA